MPSRWRDMSHPGLPSSTTGPRTRSRSARLNGFNFERGAKFYALLLRENQKVLVGKKS